MALKFSIEVSANEIEEAKASRPGGFTPYSGPRPPVGVYDFRLGKVWAGANKDGTDVIIAELIIDEEGENEVYNGCSILHRMAIPTDSSHSNHAMRISGMDSFFTAISDGEYGIREFVEDARAGRIIETGDEPNKIGTQLKSIGKLKFDKPRKARAKIRHSGEYNNIHYFLDEQPSSKKDEDDDIDPWGADGDDDLSDILGDV